MFEDFTLATVDVGDGVALRVRHGGEGRPVVLLTARVSAPAWAGAARPEGDRPSR